MADKTWKGTDATSPTDFTVAANWSPSGVPIASDRLIFDSTAAAHLAAGLSQSALAVTVQIKDTFVKYIGDGTNFLQIGATTADIHVASGGTSAGAGSARIQLAFGATANTTNIYGSAGNAADTNYMPIELTGSNITLNVSGGAKIGAAMRTGQTATVFARLTRGASDTTPALVAGSGMGATSTYEIAAGKVTSYSTATTASVKNNGGTYEFFGAGNHTLVENNKGTFILAGTGTIATLRNRGKVDGSRDARAKTITNCEAYAGAEFNLDNGVAGGLTFTNGIKCMYCGVEDVKITTPDHVTATVVAA